MEEIKFGYGNILITQNLNSIIIRKLSKNYNIGENINLSNTGFPATYTIYFREYQDLIDFKNQINNAYEKPIFIFQDIKFNFENYQRHSIDVLLDKVNWVEKFMTSNTIC